MAGGHVPVVVYDARGCGISEGKPPFSHAQWAADLDGVRQWLGDKLPFPVHSKVILTRDGVVLSFVPSFHSVQPCELL
jgi:hypothetical protein